MLTVCNRRLFVLKSFKKISTWWVCRCECGNYRTVRGHDLTTGNTKSCGCMRHGPRQNILCEPVISNEDKKKHTNRTQYPIDYFTRNDSVSSNIGKTTLNKCSECGSTIVIDNHHEPVCTNCGLIDTYINL